MDEREQRRAAARQRLAILEAMCAVIDRRQEFLDVVSLSPSADDARVALQEMFGFDEIEATATLDLQVRRFASRERRRIVDERDELRQVVRGEGSAGAS